MKKFHPKNKHQNQYPLDLYLTYEPELEEFILNKNNQTKTVNFSNSKAVRLLNRAILKCDYGINNWDFPEQYLCPPIPSRVDYIHHLSDLPHTSKFVRVLDIGTGATCIYPLLGVSEYNWKFTATDISKQSLQIAQSIIKKNQLNQHITLRHQPNKEQVLTGVTEVNEQFTFTMCNPPFYKSAQEALKENRQKTTKINTTTGRNFGGIHNELWCKGGEHHFINTYLYESSQNSTISEWFTSLVAKKDTLKTLLQSANKLNVKEVKIIPIETGNKQTRIFAWRF